jgi:hypothetical protein
MSGNNTFLAATTGTAHATGDLTATNVGTATLAGPGVAIGFAAAVAVAQNTGPVAPHTNATTDGFVSGGSITSSHTEHWSFNSPFAPVSLDASSTAMSTHGGGGDSLSSLTSPWVHGLF